MNGKRCIKFYVLKLLSPSYKDKDNYTKAEIGK
jgi:hypothetical protein